MKSFERIIAQYLLPQLLLETDPLQYAYQPKKSVNDAVLTLVHTIAQHLDKPGCYVRTTYVDFSSAFNTMQSHVLVNKLIQMNVKPSLILWLQDFFNKQRTEGKITKCTVGQTHHKHRVSTGLRTLSTFVYSIHKRL